MVTILRKQLQYGHNITQTVPIRSQYYANSNKTVTILRKQLQYSHNVTQTVTKRSQFYVYSYNTVTLFRKQLQNGHNITETVTMHFQWRRHIYIYIYIYYPRKEIYPHCLSSSYISQRVSGWEGGGGTIFDLC